MILYASIIITKGESLSEEKDHHSVEWIMVFTLDHVYCFHNNSVYWILALGKIFEFIMYCKNLTKQISFYHIFIILLNYQRMRGCPVVYGKLKTLCLLSH